MLKFKNWAFQSCFACFSDSHLIPPNFTPTKGKHLPLPVSQFLQSLDLCPFVLAPTGAIIILLAKLLQAALQSYGVFTFFLVLITKEQDDMHSTCTGIKITTHYWNDKNVFMVYVSFLSKVLKKMLLYCPCCIPPYGTIFSSDGWQPNLRMERCTLHNSHFSSKWFKFLVILNLVILTVENIIF